MRVAVDLRVLELLSARLCHELVSPIGAVNNGVELLAEDDPEFVKDAVDLIGQSGRKAGRRLQFYRFAYGFSGSAGGTGGPDARTLAAGLFEDGKVECTWSPEAATLPLDWQKLACNLVLVAAECLPRGGTIVVRPLRNGISGIEVRASGDAVTASPEMRVAIGADAVVDELTSRTVQSYFTARLAEQLGAQLTVALAPGGELALTASAG
jgi:histidine phosphotransferase ChpT